MDWFSAPDYRLTRLVLERGIGLIYLVAFAVALNQFPALLGEHGLMPAPRFLGRVCARCLHVLRVLPARRLDGPAPNR